MSMVAERRGLRVRRNRRNDSPVRVWIPLGTRSALLNLVPSLLPKREQDIQELHSPAAKMQGGSGRQYREDRDKPDED